MLNCKYVKEKFETEAFDILRYELSRGEYAFFYFKERMKKWVRNNDFKCDIEFYNDGNIVRMKVQFNDDFPFGFECAWDTDMVRRLNLKI